MRNTKYYYSIPVFIISTLFLSILSFIFFGVSYLLFIKDFNIFIIFFIWILYGLIFRDTIPRIIKIGSSVFKNQPALVLEKNNLIDNINDKLISWSDIENIEEYYDVRTGSYIAIKVKNPSRYIVKEKKLFDRIVMRTNEKYFNGLFAIRPQMIKCKKKELLDNLNLFLEENK